MLDRPRAGLSSGASLEEPAGGDAATRDASGQQDPFTEPDTAAVPADAWDDACLAIRLIAAAGPALGGIHVRARAGPVRDLWMKRLVDAIGNQRPFRRITPATSSDRLTGGLDLAETLEAGRPVNFRGLVDLADGGFMVLAMAERIEPAKAGVLAAALDGAKGEATGQSSRFALIALDEGSEPDERLCACLADRLGLTVDLTAVPWHRVVADGAGSHVKPAPAPMRDVELDETLIEAVAALSMADGGGSLRRALFIASAARLLAHLDERDKASGRDTATAVRLVIGPVSTADEEGDQAGRDQTDTRSSQEDAPSGQDAERQGDEEDGGDTTRFDPDRDQIAVDAARTVKPGEVDLDALIAMAGSAKSGAPGRRGGVERVARRGRPTGIGERPVHPGQRLNVVATLRAAAPWQLLRRAGGENEKSLRIRKSDFRYTRFKHPAEAAAIFAVDASGSTALERLGEAKGAIELLLADCYVKRAQVALIGFRGYEAERLLEPTRSLARAKRQLAALPGGGPTPLASGMAEALQTAEAARRKGQQPIIVLLTDGRGNVALNGTPGRAGARADTEQLARRIAASGVKAILIDIAVRSNEAAHSLAESMRADYRHLPRADAKTVSRIVASSIGAG